MKKYPFRIPISKKSNKIFKDKKKYDRKNSKNFLKKELRDQK